MSVRIDDAKLRQVIAQHPEAAQEWLDGLSEAILGEIVVSFGSSPAGLTYGNHVASQAGYPPNVDTGALRASMMWARVGRMHNEIRDGVLYGILLEMGTEAMRPRPFVSPVVRDWRENRVGDDMKRNLFGRLGL